MDITLLWSTDGFPPRWFCGVWTQFHGWTHILADAVIFVSYYLIPLVLLQTLKRVLWDTHRHIVFNFAVFIFCCGITHALDLLMFWWPAYRLLTLAKVITAIVSAYTVWRILPQFIRVVNGHKAEKLLKARLHE